jgi:two-component system NtrC family sensor kinase
MTGEPNRAHPELDERFNVRAYMVAPLVWRGEVLGAVTTSHEKPGVFTDADVLLLEELAEQAATSVAHAREFVAEQRQREMSEDLMRRFADQALQLERAQQQLIQNEKMTAVGQLVHGLAHEMNTPLNVVTSNMAVLGRYAETLAKISQAASQLDPSQQSEALSNALADEDDLEYVLEDLPALVDDSVNATRRVAAMVRSMASMARHDRGSRAPTAIEETLESALTLATNSLKKHAQVERKFNATTPVMGHSTELIELFVHLLMNAAQALEQPGTVTVETLDEGDAVVVRVSDTGSGVPQDVQQRVFDPFFTTRPTGQGTGMGLAVCRGIVSRHGGDISLESTVGHGTTVSVRLPTGASLEKAA